MSLTQENYDTITKIIFEKYPELSEWILICFNKTSEYQVITSLWDIGSLKPLGKVLAKMNYDMDKVEKTIIEKIKNERWDA